MIVLTEFKLLLKYLGLNPWGGFENLFLRAIYLMTFISFQIMFWTFFFSNINGHVYRALGSLPAVLACASNMVCYFHVLINGKRFSSLLNELQSIVTERTTKVGNERIYLAAEQQTRFGTNIIVYSSLIISAVCLSPFALAAYHWCLGKYTLDSWIYFLPVWTPFEMNSTLRCAVMALYQAFGITCCVFVFDMMPCLLIAFLLYSKFFFADIESLFGQLDGFSRRKLCRNHEQSKNVELDMIECCKEALDLHQKINRFLHNVADFMNAIILETIMIWTICICISLFVIEKYRGTNFLYDLQLPIITVIFPLNTLAIFFYLGQTFHSIVKNMSVEIYQLEWSTYPRNIQRFVLLVLMRSQRQFYLSAYGLMALNMENFLGVSECHLTWGKRNRLLALTILLLRPMYSALMVLHRME